MTKPENTSFERITEIKDNQLSFFMNGRTREDTAFRKEQLRALKTAILKWEKTLCDALWADLHKSYEEAYITEISIILGEIDTHLRHIDRWVKPTWKPTPLKLFPSSCRVVSQPLGNALIIAPWNYPLQLLLTPLVGAISAGCTAVLKPSPYVPHVARAVEEMISETFKEEYIAVVQGDRTVNQELLRHEWDIIFFTGSPALGRKVMEAAAKNLTPVVLELGGKSPCIVDRDADLKVAAKRIAWGKCLNAGQTCIAPDYLMVHDAVKEDFLDELEKQFRALLGDDPRTSKHFARIVNEKAFDRLTGYLKDGTVRYGGQHNREERYIAPTILDHVEENSTVMREEIFGPILPVLTVKDMEEARHLIYRNEDPLALYYFGRNGKDMIQYTHSGAICINDTIMHIANEHLPFGGVGKSGMGSYHHKKSFDAFSHQRAVLTTPTWLDLPLRYMPYKLFRLIKPFL